MSTLRRELIQRFKKIIEEQVLIIRDHTDTQEWYDRELQELSELFADSALELRGFEVKDHIHAIDMSKLPIEWQIAAGVEIKQETIDEVVLEKAALDTFEADMQVPGNWNWHPAKGSQENAWKFLREFVVKLYREDNRAFEKYQTWRTQPYARGAMSNLAIKKNPENFPASWTDFLASSAMYGKPRKAVPDSERTDLDDHGIPMSYS